jgi:hypothetical protein
MKILPKIQKTILVKILIIILKRIFSRSPEFFIWLQAICGACLSICILLQDNISQLGLPESVQFIINIILATIIAVAQLPQEGEKEKEIRRSKGNGKD